LSGIVHGFQGNGDHQRSVRHRFLVQFNRWSKNTMTVATPAARAEQLDRAVSVTAVDAYSEAWGVGGRADNLGSGLPYPVRQGLGWRSSDKALGTESNKIPDSWARPNLDDWNLYLRLAPLAGAVPRQ
jgi:hypothetical protein